MCSGCGNGYALVGNLCQCAIGKNVSMITSKCVNCNIPECYKCSFDNVCDLFILTPITQILNTINNLDNQIDQKANSIGQNVNQINQKVTQVNQNSNQISQNISQIS
jgi:hypothetical protein